MSIKYPTYEEGTVVAENKLSLFYELFGNKDAPSDKRIVIVNGCLGSRCGMHAATELLLDNDPECTVLCYDNVGVGKSSETNTIFLTTRRMARDLAAIMIDIGWESAHIVGGSMGGMITLEFGAQFPEMCQTILPWVTHAGGFGGIPPVDGALNIMQGVFIAEPAKQTKHMMPIFFGAEANANEKKHKFIYDWMMDIKDPKFRIIPTLKSVLGHFWASTFHNVSEERLLKMKAEKYPIMILTGDDDHMVRSSNSLALAKKFEIEPVLWKGAGHILAAERPEDFTQAIFDNMKAVKSEEEILQGDKIKECLSGNMCSHACDCENLAIQKGLQWFFPLLLLTIGFNLAGVADWAKFNFLIFAALISYTTLPCILNKFKITHKLRSEGIKTNVMISPLRLTLLWLFMLIAAFFSL